MNQNIPTITKRWYTITPEQWLFLLKFALLQCLFVLAVFGLYEMARHGQLTRDNTFLTVGTVIGANGVVLILALSKIVRSMKSQ